MTSDLHFDFQRLDRLGFSEAVLCAGKSVGQIEHILDTVSARDQAILLTRMSVDAHDALQPAFRKRLDYDPISRTAFLGEPASRRECAAVAIVSAGTSDVAVAREASRTLAFHGVANEQFLDIGVAGLWRLDKYTDELKNYDVIVVVAGMDGALPSVIGGLFGSLVIAVPTSTGYGVARHGETALHAALTSCAPGVVVVNIDNGYGAAIAALRALRQN